MSGEQGVTVAERPQEQGRFTPVIAADVLDQVASQHAAVLEDGRARGPSPIRFDASGDIFLTEVGHGVGGAEPVRSEEADVTMSESATQVNDARGLAVMLVEMLTGEGDAKVDAATARQCLVSVNLPGRVIDTVVSGLAQDAGERFRNPRAFAAAFRQALAETADGFISGAWEAIGRGDDAMAAVLYDMAQGYVADHPEFPVLAARFDGEGSRWAAVPAAIAVPALSASGDIGLDGKMSGDSASQRQSGNPWVVFLIGAMIGVIGLLAVVAVAFTYG